MPPEIDKNQKQGRANAVSKAKSARRDAQGRVRKESDALGHLDIVSQQQIISHNAREKQEVRGESVGQAREYSWPGLAD